MNEKAYQVNLELFEGPMDLLLFLVKKDDLDIHNIPIARITSEYQCALSFGVRRWVLKSLCTMPKRRR